MNKDQARKQEQLTQASRFFNIQKKTDMDQVHLVAPALPESQVTDLPALALFNKKVSAPFFIEAMTGGSPEALTVNQALASAASQTGIAMAVGSASMLARSKDQLASFAVAREENPDGLLFANVNPNTDPAWAQKIVQELGADVLQVHVNSAQELAMPGGDRDFHWLDNILAIKDEVSVPVIVKGVGFGFDKQSLHLLVEHGLTLVDLGGAGGTNFVQIEQARSGHIKYDGLADCGLSTAASLLLAKREKGLHYFASGGIHTPLDVIKSLALGAKAAGVAAAFLQTVETGGAPALIDQINDWREQLAGFLAFFGANSWQDLPKLPYYLDWPLKSKVDQLLN